MPATIADYLKNSAIDNVKNAIAAAKANESFNALISLTEDRALERATAEDNKSKKGRLSGVPFIAKDNYLTLGGSTTAASKMLENFKAPLQATVVEKLETEGAICIGKANLDAFAHGGSTENSAFGPTKNAHDQSRVAGGSSGGSAVVVALDIVPFALGTDTGGSIRQPASFNGVYGVKPTYGMVSRFGVVAMASGTDTMGCFAHTATDAELIMDIIAGRDEKDMTTLPDYFEPTNIDRQLKFAVIKQLMTEDVDKDVRDAVTSYAEKLRKKGHIVEEIDMPIIKYSLAMYYIIVPAEITSNLARYDGIRYGRRADASSLGDVYGKSRDEGFMAENERRIMIGSYVLSSGYFDAYYNKAQQARTLLIEAFEKQFSQYDVLLSPVAPNPAFKLGDNTSDPVKMYLEDAMTVPASLAGIPALSVPVCKNEAGLPIGVQFMAGPRQDSLLFAIAKQMERT